MSTRRRHTLSKLLGPLEAEIMEVVWDEGEVTVREVHDIMSRNRSIAYTTVMTTLARLAEKGFLKRNEDHTAHVYSAVLTREQYAKSTVKSVVDWLVTHFPEPAVTYFVDRVEKEDEEVIERLKAAIDQRRSKGA